MWLRDDESLNCGDNWIIVFDLNVSGRFWFLGVSSSFLSLFLFFRNLGCGFLIIGVTLRGLGSISLLETVRQVLRCFVLFLRRAGYMLSPWGGFFVEFTILLFNKFVHGIVLFFNNLKAWAGFIQGAFVDLDLFDLQGGTFVSFVVCLVLHTLHPFGKLVFFGELTGLLCAFLEELVVIQGAFLLVLPTLNCCSI